MNIIKLTDCQKGYLYKIQARNFNYGVFNGEIGFIGVREKFGHKYLFTEYHHDCGPPFGTVNPTRELEFCPIDPVEGWLGPKRIYNDNTPLFYWIAEKEAEWELLISSKEGVEAHE